MSLFQYRYLSKNRIILLWGGLTYSLCAMLTRVCNIVTGNPRTREKTRESRLQGMGGLRFWDFQVYRTGTRSFFSHMVFLGNSLADPKTRKCHFNNQHVFYSFNYCHSGSNNGLLAVRLTIRVHVTAARAASEFRRSARASEPLVGQ